MWQLWTVMLIGTRDDYVVSWDTSWIWILMEGPFCKTWYLRKRFVLQTLESLDPVVPALLSPSMITVDGLSIEAIVQFMAGQDANLFRRIGDFVAFIRTHLMPPLIGARAGDAIGAPAARGVAHTAELGTGGVALAIHVASLPMIPTSIPCWWPSGTAYQILIEPPEEEHKYVRDPNVQQVLVDYVDCLLELVASLV